MDSAHPAQVQRWGGSVWFGEPAQRTGTETRTLSLCDSRDRRQTAVRGPGPDFSLRTVGRAD